MDQKFAKLDRNLLNKLLELIVVILKQFVAYFNWYSCRDVVGRILKVWKHKNEHFLLALWNLNQVYLAVKFMEVTVQNFPGW